MSIFIDERDSRLHFFSPFVIVQCVGISAERDSVFFSLKYKYSFFINVCTSGACWGGANPAAQSCKEITINYYYYFFYISCVQYVFLEKVFFLSVCVLIFNFHWYAIAG